MRNLITVDPGFREEGIVAVTADLRRSAIPRDARLDTFNEVMERIRVVPGVQHAAETAVVPMSGSAWNQNVIVDGEQKDGSST